MTYTLPAAGILQRFGLTGRVAIVSGASAGLGVTIARGLAEAGADVVLAARRADRLAETAAAVEATGRRSLVVPTDIGSVDDCRRVVEASIGEFGRLDVLVNNAGTGEVGPAHKQPSGEFDRTLDINLAGAYRLSVAAAAAMTDGGSIINISSVLAFTTAGIPQAAYAASKAGLLGLTRDLAHQWTGRRGIRVNAVAPGFFATDMTEGYDAHMERRVADRIPAGRLGSADDLLGAIVYLASDASRYVTGSTLTVDGGFMIS
ncbi:SDR family NAD(P)-dependent oxidoreductase [Pseudonocardia pini]|uniref:SDR family NAD(P)-dependent oxidoreductase n=1 Tax=Pseudonocardia pini TaxID=2758030 RepID=UPI0015F05EB9|nr:SDR family oxidoreductase [Pseudonocardia pini]